MFLNRHFFVIVFSVLFIGIILWWQNPETAALAMSRGEYNSNSYNVIKNYWKRLDYRQFELASEMITQNARKDHADLENLLTQNSLLSIQKVGIELTSKENEFLVKATLGSVIDQKQEINYLVNVEQTEKGWLITSISCISQE
jgi:hypothetical protein